MSLLIDILGTLIVFEIVENGVNVLLGKVLGQSDIELRFIVLEVDKDCFNSILEFFILALIGRCELFIGLLKFDSFKPKVSPEKKFNVIFSRLNFTNFLFRIS